MSMLIVIIIAFPWRKSAFGRLELPNSRYSSNAQYENSQYRQLNTRILYFVESASRYFLGKWPNWRAILFYVFISILYMFRATPCSSSGESTVSIHLMVICHSVSVTVSCAGRKGPSRPAHERSPTQVVLIQLILLMMSTGLLETCRELK